MCCPSVMNITPAKYRWWKDQEKDRKVTWWRNRFFWTWRSHWHWSSLPVYEQAFTHLTWRSTMSSAYEYCFIWKSHYTVVYRQWKPVVQPAAPEELQWKVWFMLERLICVSGGLKPGVTPVDLGGWVQQVLHVRSSPNYGLGSASDSDIIGPGGFICSSGGIVLLFWCNILRKWLVQQVTHIPECVSPLLTFISWKSSRNMLPHTYFSPSRHGNMTLCQWCGIWTRWKTKVWMWTVLGECIVNSS